MSDESARHELRRIGAHFAGWTLDIVRRRLHAPDGATTHLPGTESALLLAFLDRPRQGHESYALQAEPVFE